MASLSVALSPYFPKWVITSLCEQWGAGDRPFSVKRQASVLFLDVADFSGQTEKFALLGARGAEELSTILNGCFSVLTEIIDGHSGDIVAFAGDGLVALWEESDASAAALVAAKCGLALQDALSNWAKSSQQDIRVRVSIEVGEVFLCRVGGVDGRWQYLVTGTPIQAAGAAYRKCGIGQVILCLPRSRRSESFVRRVVDDVFFRVAKVTQAISSLSPKSNSPPPSDLQLLVPRVVLDRAIFGEGRWLAEFRKLTIVYIQLSDISLDACLLTKLQSAIFAIQTYSCPFRRHDPQRPNGRQGN